MERVIEMLDKATFKALLFDLGRAGWAIGIVRLLGGAEWEGVASFPRALEGEARRRFSELETDIDVEDLLREWADPDGRTLRDFESFMRGAGRRENPSTLLSRVGHRIRPERARVATKPALGKKERVPRKALPIVSETYAPRRYPRPTDARANTSKLLPLAEYETVIVSFSGGKDSIACALLLLEQGIPAEHIELWHQAVDGKPGKDERLFDWPCTEAYCVAFAKAFGFPLLFQWKEGGFKREMLRDETATAPTSFQLPSGKIETAGGAGPSGTRLKFPQVSADLSTRWCSAYLKIDVASRVFSNDPRFANGKFVICTGERRQESGNRARYAEVDEHKATTRKRRVDQWRPVLGWFEEDVWEIMRRYNVRPHPAYYLGWSRVSCFPCIFGDPHQWASVGDIAPGLLEQLVAYEKQFGVTLRRDGNLLEAAGRGTSYVTPDVRSYVEQALSEEYDEDQILSWDTWELPKGAYGHSGGPT